MDQQLIDMPPPIESLATWWPLIGFGVSLFLAACSAAWAAWLQFQQWKNSRTEKQIESDRERNIQAEQRKQAVEIEELKLNFEQRQKLLDSLSKQFEMQLDEGRKMREELTKARDELRNRDQIISELRQTIAEMQIRIKHLEKELHVIEGKQTAHESQHRRSET